VRGASFEAIKDANLRINRALAASAAAFGGNVHLSDLPGYAPLINDLNMQQASLDVVSEFMAEGEYGASDAWGTGCTDVGDVSAVMPAIQPHIGGCVGIGHGNNYFVQDVETACVLSAKVQVATAWKLLKDDAALAKNAIEKAELRFPSIKDYLAYVDELTLDKNAVIYNELNFVFHSHKHKTEKTLCICAALLTVEPNVTCISCCNSVELLCLFSICDLDVKSHD